jgi:hypothetical protein
MVAFTAGAVLTAANLNTAFNALTLRTVTGTSDTLLLDDNGGGVTYSNAAATTSTIPPNSSVAFAVGTKIVLINLGAGVVTVTAGAGVTVNGSVLTLAQDAGGTCIKTATNTWYFLPSASAGAGMDLITPTSVAGSGVTLSGGQVTFTAATAVSVNGCFSATYDNYRIVFEGVGSTVDVPKLRLRLAGTDASGANYDFEQVTGSTTTVSAQNYASETSWSYFTAQSTVSMIGEVIIRRPNLAQTTMVSGQGGRENAVVMVTGYHTLTTQYDGFSLLAPSGNLTGTLRVYGMRNS